MTRLITLCGAAAFAFLPACGGDEPAAADTVTGAPGASGPGAAAAARRRPPRPVRLDMTRLEALFGSDPGSPEIDNPSTPEKVALGRVLYHEEHLSKNGNLSCASCHDLADYGQDGRRVSPGSDGVDGARNTPTTWNAFRQFAQFWDYRAATVEEQATGPMFNPVEHGLADAAALVAKIEEKPELVAAFAAAFPGEEPVTAENFELAVGAFERTLVTRSRFDEFLDGDASALTNDEKRGLEAFIDVGCTQCHMSRLVGGAMPQKHGVHAPYDSPDKGRFEVTGQEVDKHFFKVPPLLNVAKTAPYNHDGGIATLEEEVRHMAKVQLAKELTDEQVASIVAFLEALTGELPADIVPRK